MATSQGQGSRGDDFQNKSVPFLQRYLKHRGVSVDKKRKAELVDLARNAAELNLKVIDVDTRPEPEADDIVSVDGISLPHPYMLPTSEWSDDISSLIDININDVFVYCMEFCGWGKGRLKRYKEDNGWQLHQVHVILNT